MDTLYYFHIKLTETSEWTIELGHSLAHVMAHIASYDVEPYAWFKTDY